MVGTTFSGRYKLDEKIASGGMGSVYLATDERLARKVAVKVLKENLADDPRFVERFRREARAVAALSHPNIANVFDYGEEESNHYIVMEMIKGRDLARLLREEGPLDPDRAREIAAETALALGHAHSAGVIHRDVKPGNIIVADDGRVKVTDFGIARAVGDATLTVTGTVLGSAHYLSPEHASGGEVLPASDIYSLGIVLYEMLTGAVPFTGETPIAIAMRHVSDEVPPPSRRSPDIPHDLDNIVRTATAKAPSDRYANGAEMAEVLAGTSAATATVPVAGAVAPPTAAMGPATAGATTERTQTVWPIPGRRWDPYKVGRIVFIVLFALGLLAAVLLAMRLASDDEPSAEAPRDRGGAPPVREPSPTPSPSPTPTLPDLIGSNFPDAETVLKDAGYEVEKEEVDSDAPKDTVIDMDPDAGTPLLPGSEVTLVISKGPEEDDDGDNGNGPDGEPPGQEKKEGEDG